MTREEAIQRLYRMGRSHVGIIDENTLADNKALSMAIEALADRPMGKWIMHIDDLYPEESTQECSNCHKHETIFIRHDNYCPNCGAKMKGEK